MRALFLPVASCLLTVSVIAGPSIAASLPTGPPAAPAVPTITVRGTGAATVAPDRAVVRITIETDATTSAAAASANARTTQAVTAALRGAGVAAQDLSTEGYLVQPRWRYSPSAPPVRVGYEATTSLRLQVAPLAKLGTWIDAAVAAGASGIGQPSFRASHEAAARAQALSEAIRQARSDAEALASAAGGSLGALEEISTAPSGTAPGLQEIAVTAARRTPEGEPTIISPPLLQIQATVTARWAFVPGR